MVREEWNWRRRRECRYYCLMERKLLSVGQTTTRSMVQGVYLVFVLYMRAMLTGRRALAESWEETPHAAMSTFHNALSSISLFVLLDLLGAENPGVPSYFKTTHWAYQHLAGIEERLRGLGALQSKPTRAFLPDSKKESHRFNSYGVQDDHIPFMARGVEVLHLIPGPFPRVWHTMDDDGEHLDMPTVEDWTKIVAAFVGEWMDLEGHFPPKAQAEAKAKRKVEKTEL
jgi:glutaminyl-peptide cyclotransferase